MNRRSQASPGGGSGAGARGGGPRSTESPTRFGWALAIGAFLLPVLFLPTLSWTADAPKTAVLWVLTGAGLPLLVLLALGRGPARGSFTRTWGARAAITFVVVAGIATVLSKAPLHSLVGGYTSMTGLLFFAGLAACWALG
ncbi:MAG: hypothetical protein ACYDHU_11405, partial [Acidimicrobiales bacterium]